MVASPKRQKLALLKIIKMTVSIENRYFNHLALTYLATTTMCIKTLKLRDFTKFEMKKSIEEQIMVFWGQMIEYLSYLIKIICYMLNTENPIVSSCK